MNRHAAIGLSCVTATLVAIATVALSAQAQSDSGPVDLGTVRVSRAVRADGKPLPAGTYQVRVTSQVAEPAAPGQTPQYERWVEFVQGGQVRGREVVTVVPNSEISQVAEGKPPASGGYRVELLKGNDYLRLWINRGGNHYLVHFVV
jgi:hypothetical protein